jgi:hypothetical protein
MFWVYLRFVAMNFHLNLSDPFLFFDPSEHFSDSFGFIIYVIAIRTALERDVKVILWERIM